MYKLYDDYKAQIKVLKKQKQEAVDLMAVYKRKLDYFKQLIGLKWASYEVENGLYTFQDSSTFDMYTQEFRFKESDEKEHFEVRLLAIPESCLSSLADEVMLHISLIDAVPNYNSRIQLELNDVFASDKLDLSTSIFNESDSVSVRQFFEALLDKKMEFSIEANANGVGFWNGAEVVKSMYPKEEKQYKLDRMDSTYLRLRK